MTTTAVRPRSEQDRRELRTDLVARAQQLRRLLAANAERTDRDRGVPVENMSAIADAGLLRLLQPSRLGGLETDFRTLLEVAREIGRGCGSTGWVTTLLNATSWFVGLFPAEAQEEMWGDHPGARTAGVVTPSGVARPVPGGLEVTGRWAPASGCLHADWAVLGVRRPDAEGTTDATGLVLVPMTELTIQDTWFVTGMRGTASNTLSGEGIFVPAHRFLSAPDAFEGRAATPYTEEALYRAPLVPVSALVLVGPQLGLAAAALDILVEKAPRRSLTYTTYATQAQAPTVQLAAGRAASLADGAELHAYRAADDLDATARAGGFPDYDARARMRMDAGTAAVNAREAIRIICSAQGSSSFGESNPLQRIWRDAETGSRHAVLNPEVATEIYGASLFGIRGTVSELV